MISVQQALTEVIHENELLQFGMSNQLFNLSQLGKYLRSSVEARVKKSVSDSALVMGLSRAQRSLKPRSRMKQTKFTFENIQVSSNLVIQTYTASKERRQAVASLVRELQAQGRFISFTHSVSQMTLFFGKEDLVRVRELMHAKPLHSLDSVAVIGGVFDEKFASAPGLFNAVFQHLYMQGINILEVSSTFTELLIYVNEKDTRLAFDTLYARFVRGYD